MMMVVRLFWVGVAHGEVCTELEHCQFKLGPGWDCSLLSHFALDIWLTERNAHGASVKKMTPSAPRFDSVSFQAVSQSESKGNVPSTEVMRPNQTLVCRQRRLLPVRLCGDVCHLAVTLPLCSQGGKMLFERPLNLP